MKKTIITIVTLLFWINSFAQTRKIDSTLVTFYPTSFDSISLNSPKYLDTTTFHANNFDILGQNNTIHSTLSNIGQAYKPMRFQSLLPVGFNLDVPSFAHYIKTDKDLKTYLSLLPYSEIRYVMTTKDKEQHLNFKFGRQIVQGLFLSFEYNINYSPGIYTNNKTENNYFWINALYTTKDQRYRALAYWFRNKIEVQENGGIIYDSVYVNQIESDNSVILTNLTNSTNYIKVSGAGFEQYLNLLSQNKKTKKKQSPFSTQPVDNIQPIDSIQLSDSIQPIDSIQSQNIIPTTDDQPADTVPANVSKRKFTLGRLTHSFRYQRNQLSFNETSASLPFYAASDTLLNTKTTDTTIIHAFRNSIKWNSLGYQNYSDDVPFYVYAGIDYDFYKIRYHNYFDADSTMENKHSQVCINAGIIINLFKSTTLSGKAKLVTLGYQIGDFNIDGQWRQYLGTKGRNFGKLTVNFNMKRQSPTWFESNYHSNHFYWENDFHAATYLCFDAQYHYKFFNVGIRQNSINDIIYFNKEAKPTQYDGFVSVSEVFGDVSFHWKKLNIEGFVALQKASNEDIIHLPLLLSRVKIGYAQPIFKKAAVLQPILTVTYFTKYHADAYMPALRTFYLQDDILIGNFPFIDLALAINVKQADIYVQYSNMFLLTGNHNSFIAPHYPMRDSRFFIGINWRLFN